MKLQSTLSLRPDFLYLAPLLNIVLLLLIFFLLNSNLVVRSGIRVDLPVSLSSLKPLERAHIVTIQAGEAPAAQATAGTPGAAGTTSAEDPAGLPGISVWLNDQRVYTGDLTAALEAVKSSTRMVIVNADQSIPVGFVQRVHNAVLAAGCDLAIGTQVAP